MLRKLRDKALARVLGVNPKKKKPDHPMPEDPKELAKALFWGNDQKIKEQRYRRLPCK